MALKLVLCSVLTITTNRVGCELLFQILISVYYLYLLLSNEWDLCQDFPCLKISQGAYNVTRSYKELKSRHKIFCLNSKRKINCHFIIFINLDIIMYIFSSVCVPLTVMSNSTLWTVGFSVHEGCHASPVNLLTGIEPESRLLH